MNDVRIRRARVEDASCLAEAESETAAGQEGLLVARPGEIPVEAYQTKIKALSERGLYIVIELDGQPVGHLLLDPLPLAAAGHVVSLTIVVHPKHTGRGYGTALMQNALAWFREQSEIEKIELRVRSTNRRALAFYQSHGFVIEGVLRRRLKLSNAYADDICMALFA
ncbi:GNAT family N-acetyltransferase [Roseiconus nitratireducens]|uniref:GNAT family N-acetyltransferase n=1 Tax=Roseiconus nitratireducens TaxID=2605748 RepID=UPI00137566C4|nr:GNAT family N-acetyltransferase [Roseiconus nitratireducens]